MKICQPVSLPPDQKGDQQIGADLIDCAPGLIFDRQKINDGNRKWDTEAQQQE